MSVIDEATQYWKQHSTHERYRSKVVNGPTRSDPNHKI